MIFPLAAHAGDGARDPVLDAAPVADVKHLQGQLDPALIQAVAAAQKAEAPPAAPAQAFSGAPAFSSANAAIMTAAFDEAQVPDCLHSQGLKRQPTFFLAGYLALPFIAVAKLRGKCQ
ncbi:hypothetical protein ASF61_08730 [Duganella sp. Leaf126]|uniref:hypothetical protein n=1 Tax=Duganella sp. Leaf126 TaxID=1736266 RepID=UPI0006FBCE0F|nr:hypothetical protein [Duganella sp. Leaf126]KQQ36253.1 hypothetical protein ASF61_08730 [Duganella sp. Leaf126]